MRQESVSLTRFLQQSFIDKDLLPVCERVMTNLNGSQHVDAHNREITFIGAIVGERSNPDGTFNLVRWYPEGM